MNLVHSVNHVNPHLQSKTIFELNEHELSDYWVSEHSQFKDRRWIFTNLTPGSDESPSTLNWGMTLYDGTRLTAVQHAVRLHWARVLMLTMLKVPAQGRPPAPGSMGGHQQCFKWLLSWMAEQEYHRPEELTPEVVDHYIDDLPRFILEQRDDETLSPAAVRRALDVVGNLWRQRVAMRKMNLGTLVKGPFHRSSIPELAESISGKGMGWIQPLPDEVAVPVFNKAYWFIGQPADDVLRLAEVSNFAAGESVEVRKVRIRRCFKNFQFSQLPGELGPWHPLLNAKGSIKHATTSRVRNLFTAAVGACAIIVQGTSGMRISELCGIKAGINPESGLPANIRIEQSITGLYEWFVIRTELSKTVEGAPTEVDWVLGMRPKGSKDIPPAVAALQLLNKLYAQWRPCALSDRLFLRLKSHISLPRASTPCRAITADTLRQTMKNFICDWVDLSGLPDESKHKVSDNDLASWRVSKGRIFSTHMLRKSWASYTLAVNPSLLGAIQMQFHHLSLAMTEGGYIGRNPLQVELIDSVSRQKRNSMIFELITGKSALAGRMGQQLVKATETLTEELDKLPASEKWLRVAEWADKNDLHLFFSFHATCCPTRTSEMRCHNAVDTPSWIRRQPNYATREPSLCVGCACAIMDKSHEPFWSERYMRSWRAVKEAESANVVPPLRIIKERAEQAGSILRQFGTDLAVLDSQIDKDMETYYAKA